VRWWLFVLWQKSLQFFWQALGGGAILFRHLNMDDLGGLCAEIIFKFNDITAACADFELAIFNGRRNSIFYQHINFSLGKTFCIKIL
jgi:hypothetical protein